MFGKQVGLMVLSIGIKNTKDKKEIRNSQRPLVINRERKQEEAVGRKISIQMKSRLAEFQ